MSGIVAPGVITLETEGVLTTSLVAKAVLPFGGKITGAYAVVATAPTGAALNATLVNGALNAGQFVIAAGQEKDEASLTEANCTFEKGTIIAVTISQIGSSYAGKDLTVAVTYEPASDAGAPLQYQYDFQTWAQRNA